MGTVAKKVLRQASGVLTEETTLKTSAGAGDADKIVSLNGSGRIDDTMLNIIASSSGAGDSGRIPVLDGSGRLDTTFMPASAGSASKTAVSQGALSAGDFVNLFESGGILKARKASAANSTNYPAHGFVLAGTADTATATVYLNGLNNKVQSQPPLGRVFLNPSDDGGVINTIPTGSGELVQIIGVCLDSQAGDSTVMFQNNEPIQLA